MNQPGWAPLPVPPTPPQAPYFAAPPPPPQKPSGAYKALGIVQAALGAAGVLYALFGIAMSAFVMASATSKSYGAAALILLYGRAGVNVVTGALLVVTGIGVFRAKRWARWSGVAYAAISLFETFGGTALNWIFVMPRTLGTSGVPREFQMIAMATTAVSVVFACILPTVTLVALLNRRARTELDQ